MEGRKVGKGFNPMVQRARSFYSSFGDLGSRMYSHAHDGFKLGRKIGMIESIEKRKDPLRARANELLGLTQLYHTVDPSKLGRLPTVPDTLKDPELLEQLTLFDRIKDHDRNGDGIDSYSKLINGGKMPLAMLAVLVDYATTHRMEDHLDQLVSTDSCSSIFRTFPTLEEVERSYRKHAYAGLKLHAPIAELFGYPLLAGDIFAHAFHTLYPGIHAHVLSSLEDPQMQRKLEITQSVVRGQARMLRDTLEGLGFDVSVSLRRQKHPGKLMRKIHRKALDHFEQSDEFRIANLLHEPRWGPLCDSDPYQIRLQRFMEWKVPLIALDEMNDLVALRVILERFQGRSLDDMPEEQTESIVSLASNQIRVVLEASSMSLSSKGATNSLDFNMESNRKSNGYRANHFDVTPNGGSLLKFEIQLKTSLWHAMAEHGYAAHFYYLGGDKEYVDMIARSASDILSGCRNGKNGNGNGVPIGATSVYLDSS